jgi:hypothetical protein
MRLPFLYYPILKDRRFVLENPIVFGVFSAMIPYGTFRAVRENNQSAFILIGLIGEKPGENFIGPLILGSVFAHELVSILEWEASETLKDLGCSRSLTGIC